MYVFNRITVNPQLPKNINRLQEIANNLWWSWNSEFLNGGRMLKLLLKLGTEVNLKNFNFGTDVVKPVSHFLKI